MAKEPKNVTNTADEPIEQTGMVPVANSAPVAFMDEDTGIEGELLSASNQYCSFVPRTQADRIALYNAINMPQHSIGDEVNTVINMRYLFMEKVRLLNKKTGEINDANRIVIIDDKLEGHSCVASGVFSSLKKMCGKNMFGDPGSWTDVIKVVPKTIKKSAEQNILTLTLAQG